MIERHPPSRKRTTAALAAGGALLFGSLATATPAGADYLGGTGIPDSAPEQFIVTFQPSMRTASTETRTETVEEVLKSHSRTVSDLRTMGNGNSVVRLDKPLSNSQVGDFLTRLGEADGVARVEVDRKRYADAGHQHGHPARRRSRGTDEGQPSPR